MPTSRIKYSFAWSAALAAAALLGTLATACMMPFVAIAVAAAATMGRRQAAVTIVGIWAINQILGFGLLGYPLTRYALSWGAALGLASLAAMLIASMLLAGRRIFGLRLPLAFLIAFAAYESALFVFAFAAGGTGTFTAPIVLAIASNDALWFVGLVALHEVLTRAAPRVFGPTLSLRTA